MLSVFKGCVERGREGEVWDGGHGGLGVRGLVFTGSIAGVAERTLFKNFSQP